MAAMVPEIEKWRRLQTSVHETKVKAAFEAFRGVGIEPVLIKGWAAARNYARNAIRQTGDIDLAVSPDQYQAALDLVTREEVGRLFIDLKSGLSSLDSVDWNELFAHSTLVELQGAKIRVLSPEDHLRILCNHWLIDGGRFKNKLWDIYYAVENRPEDFDWERCLEIVPQNRKDWVIIAIAIAHKYLVLRIDDLPFMANARPIPMWIIKSIEREWKRGEELVPILATTSDKRRLLHQIGRRLPPNPIRATIEADGDLYGNMRWAYQLMVLTRRAGPFLKSLLQLITRGRRKSPIGT